MCIQYLDVLAFDNRPTSSATLEKQFFEVLGAINLFIVYMEVNSFTNLVVSNGAREAIEVILLVKSLKYLTLNLLATSMASFSEKLIEVLFTIGTIVVFVKLVSFKGFGTFGANKMIRVPRFAKGRNVLSFDDFVAVSTFWIERTVVATFTEDIIVLFNEGLSTQGGGAGIAAEAFSVVIFVFSNDESSTNCRATLHTSLPITTSTPR
jgi:hypothetical protein